MPIDPQVALAVRPPQVAQPISILQQVLGVQAEQARTQALKQQADFESEYRPIQLAQAKIALKQAQDQQAGYEALKQFYADRERNPSAPQAQQVQPQTQQAPAQPQGLAGYTVPGMIGVDESQIEAAAPKPAAGPPQSTLLPPGPSGQYTFARPSPDFLRRHFPPQVAAQMEAHFDEQEERYQKIAKSKLEQKKLETEALGSIGYAASKQPPELRVPFIMESLQHTGQVYSSALGLADHIRQHPESVDSVIQGMISQSDEQRKIAATEETARARTKEAQTTEDSKRDAAEANRLKIAKDNIAKQLYNAANAKSPEQWGEIRQRARAQYGDEFANGIPANMPADPDEALNIGMNAHEMAQVKQSKANAAETARRDVETQRNRAAVLALGRERLNLSKQHFDYVESHKNMKPVKQADGTYAFIGVDDEGNSVVIPTGVKAAQSATSAAKDKEERMLDELFGKNKPGPAAKQTTAPAPTMPTKFIPKTGGGTVDIREAHEANNAQRRSKGLKELSMQEFVDALKQTGGTLH